MNSLLRDPLPWLLLALIAATLGMPAAAPLFARTFPDIDPPVYGVSSFAALLLSHAGLVFAATAAATALGVALGIFVTSPMGREFRPMVLAITGIGLTFPPTAVLALAVPALGFGARPTLLALAIYALLPIVENTVAGLENVPAAVKQAAAGLGFRPRQIFWSVELPLAAPVILSGIRVATIVNIGTATIGSTMGADTLGTPIIDGLVGQKMPYILQGSIILGLFAMLVDAGFGRLVRRFEQPESGRGSRVPWTSTPTPTPGSVPPDA